MSFNRTNVEENLLFCHGLRLAAYKHSSLIFWNVAFTILLNAVIGIFSTLANLSIICVVWRRSHLRSRTNILFTYLAITDTLVGTCALPLSAVFRIHQAKGIHICKLGTAWAFSAYLLCLWSVSVIWVICIDRYVAIFYPMAYRRRKYERRRNFLLFASWFCLFLFILSSFLGLISYLFFSIVVFVLLFVTLSSGVYCYVRIIFKLRTDARKRGINGKAFNNHLIRRQCTTAGLVALAFVATYFPRLVVTIVISFYHKSNFELIYLSGLWSETLVYLNSAINPLLYFWRLKNVRATILEFLLSLRLGKRKQTYNLQMKKSDRRERYIKRLCSN